MQQTLATIADARAALQRRDFDRVAAFAQARLRRDPDDAAALLLAGETALETGRNDDAFDAFSQILSRDKDNVDALCGRSAAALARRDVPAALDDAKRALKLAPKAHGAFMALGPPAICEQDNESVADCFAYLETIPLDQALQLVEFWSSCLTYLERFDKAAVVYRSLIDSLPPDYERYTRYAESLLRAFKPEQAKPIIDQAVAMAPDRAEAYSLLARWGTQTGDLEAARKAARDAITRDRQHDSAYIQLARLEPKDITDEDVKHLSAMLNATDMPAQKRFAAGLSLGMGLEQRRDYDAAFAAFHTANSAARDAAFTAGRGYDPRATEAQVARTKALFTPAMLHASAGDSTAGRDLIFIAGMPRSGTTLLDQILASHSRVQSVGEHLVMPSIHSDFLSRVEKSGDAAEAVIARHGGEWSKLYRHSISAARGGADFVVDKNLMNFWSVGLITRLFPAAKIILMKRDPMDVCLSIFRLNFMQFYNFSYDLMEIAHYHRCHDNLTAYWREALPDTTMNLLYEDMVEDLAPNVARVLHWCGLDMEEACLKFHENKRAVFTLSSAQVRKGVFTTSRERWRKYEKHLGPLKAALGLAGA